MRELPSTIFYYDAALDRGAVFVYRPGDIDHRRRDSFEAS